MNSKWLSGQGHAHVTSMTWVQVPGLAKFPIIFLHKILCFTNFQVHHTSQDQALTRLPGDQTKGLDLRDTLHLVKGITPEPKSQWTSKLMGQKFQAWTLQIGDTPPWFALLFFILSLIFLFYFFSFYLINYFHKNIKTFKKIRKDHKKYNFYLNYFYK